MLSQKAIRNTLDKSLPAIDRRGQGQTYLSQPDRIDTTALQKQDRVLSFAPFIATKQALERCFSGDFLPALSHRYFKLSLEILVRFETWLRQLCGTAIKCSVCVSDQYGFDYPIEEHSQLHFLTLLSSFFPFGCPPIATSRRSYPLCVGSIH